MTLYVYAITDRPDEPLPDQPGLEGAKLVQVVWRDIAAVVSAHGGALRQVDADDVWRHEEVIESLMIGRAVLPARFGTLLSRRQLDDTLCRAHSALVRDIERVRGHVEIGVRFLPIADPETTTRAPSDISAGHGASPGTAYLLTKLSEERDLRNKRHGRLELVREVFERSEGSGERRHAGARAERPRRGLRGVSRSTRSHSVVSEQCGPGG